MNPSLDLLRRMAGAVPGDGPEQAEARRKAMEAVNLVTEALRVDPTLAEPDRGQQRNFDLIAELLRQMKPLCKQVAQLQGKPTTGRTNPMAVWELETQSTRVLDVADEVRAAAWPDWHVPERRHQRAEHLMPHPDELAVIADDLRKALAPSLAVYRLPEAERLLAVADQIAYDQTILDI